jgi:aconitate hydratase
MTPVREARAGTFELDGERYRYHSVPAAARLPGLEGLARLPRSLQVLVEGMLRHAAAIEDPGDILRRLANGERGMEIPFWPARVLHQDMLGAAALVDIAALRDAVAAAGGDPAAINLKVPADFVIDHSLIAHHSGAPDAMARNMALEFSRNRERFEFIAWCQKALGNLRVIPPGNGIMHQINLEYLATVVTASGEDGERLAYPDTLVGTDSHTPMVNGLGVLGWGVGGIEAEAVMLGRKLSLRAPEVVGVELRGTLGEGVLATDLVLTLTELMRREDVVGKFVEFFGAGLDALALPDRATVSNMTPEFGATAVYFPIDRQTTGYLALTGRGERHVRLVEAYARAQGWWRTEVTPRPAFDRVIEVDLDTIERTLAGPRRPEDRVLLREVRDNLARELPALRRPNSRGEIEVRGAGYKLHDGDIVIAAITSCTNTSNPSAMIAAGLVAQKAAARGLKSKPWVKTTLNPGSKVVMAYLERAGLDVPLGQLGFYLAGFGCASCGGMSGPLADPVAAAIREGALTCVAVLSGNRNFEGRTHPLARAAYLAAPPLVVAYAIAGSLNVDLTRDPLGTDPNGAPVYLDDIWPRNEEIARVVQSCVTREMFVRSGEVMLEGNAAWRGLQTGASTLFPWRPESTYLRRPPFFDDLPPVPPVPRDLPGLRPLAILGDSINTDHLSPAGEIPEDSATGRYLAERGVAASDFNLYSARRGNFEVGMRMTLANLRVKNAMVPGSEGPVTRLMPEGTRMPIFDAAAAYRERGTPLVIVAGRNYGCGSSRDWAAKGVALLGVKAVVAESFERIHRSNLIGMGVLPLQLDSARCADLGLDGTEVFDVTGLGAGLGARQRGTLHVRRLSGAIDQYDVVMRLDTAEEIACYTHGGILPMVYREFMAETAHGRKR